MSTSEDEFAYFLDPGAAGIDLDSIPGLSSIPLPSQSSTQTLVDTPALAEPRPSTPLPTREDSNAPSSQYSFDEVDATFLDELDKVEQMLLQSQEAGPSADREEGPSTHSNAESELTSRYFHGWHAEGPQTGEPNEDIKDTNSNAEGSRGDLSSPIPEPEVKSTVVCELSSPPTEGPSRKRRKEKHKESSRKKLKEYLNNFEDEIICPICCDIFAIAHLGNPCGHTFCGECGWRWIKKNREAPSCAICRANLSVDAPMIPNFAVDSAVEKHVQALRTSRVDGWESDGSKFTEWQARKERWKADSTRLMARRSTTANLPVVVASYALQGSLLGGSDYEREAASSSDESRGSEELRLPSTNQRRTQRRVPNHHREHQRRTGSNRRSREHHDNRGGTGSRGRRSRRGRRDH